MQAFKPFDPHLEAEMQDLNASVHVDLSRRYTLEEFWALPRPEEGAHYELIDGYLYRVPPPDPSEANLAAKMARALTGFLEANEIDGEVHFGPEPIYRRVEGSTNVESD